ncbi:phage tail protein [Aeromonas hydrophila]|uniref:phage tail protein n=1 Tax=Aeromonas hydrophila TaxID=644 RepID=UPI001FF5B6BA|nr:phage tail protein [Aeromonas hydrophila]MCK0185443.1 phage tail protein [Aeromonas hydrophila]UOV92678.1 phage tail protein [Aeromonas hydrophila]
MLKPAAIRDVIASCVPQLAQNPDRLILTVGDGRIVATGARSLSFEWQYPLSIGVIDFAGHPDQLVVPLLAWLRQNQPELFTNPDKRENAIKVESELLAGDLYDLLITIQLNERVIVKKTELGIGWEHVEEPPEDPYDGITWELFINGEHQPWPPTPSSN